MFDLGDYILKITIIMATIWIVRRFWGSFFEKKDNSVLSIIGWLSFCVFQFISQYNNVNINIVMTFVNALLILLIAICGYECKGKEKYFLLIVFCSVWSLTEIFVFFLLCNARLEKENLKLMGMVVSTLFMMILVSIISMVWNKSNSELIPNNFYLYLLFIPLGSIYIAVNQFYSDSNKISSAITISILLLFNIIIFEIYTKMNEMFMYEKERTVYAQQIDMISFNTLEQKKIMEDFHEEKHNLINELIVLKGGVEKDDKEMVIRNINKIINNCQYVETISDSGNDMIDALINFKYAVAKEYGIDFRLKIFISNELPIEQCDIGVVLGNAIDNSIEAVKECVNHKKVIEISMGVKKEALIVVIRNPYEHAIKKDRAGRILSTKKEKYRHGYGLKAIMKISEEYQGEVIIDAENSFFSLTVILNFGDF